MSLPSAEILLCIAERFQTMLVGVLGFAGVILTLWHNARAARRQSDRILSNEQASISSALYAELAIHREALQKAVVDFQASKKNAGEKIMVPINSVFPVYDALLPRIGVLPSHKVQAVIYAYLTVGELFRSLTMFGKHDPDYKCDGDYVSVNVTRVEQLAKMFASVLPPFDKAIREVVPNVEKS